MVYVHSECHTQCKDFIFYGAAHSWLGCYTVANSRLCSSEYLTVYSYPVHAAATGPPLTNWNHGCSNMLKY